MEEAARVRNGSRRTAPFESERVGLSLYRSCAKQAEDAPFEKTLCSGLQSNLFYPKPYLFVSFHHFFNRIPFIFGLQHKGVSKFPHNAFDSSLMNIRINST